MKQWENISQDISQVEEAHPGHFEHVRLGWTNRRMVVSDLPVAIDLPPHVGEASLHRASSAGLAQLERVHARVKIGIASVHLDTVVRDGAERVLLDEGLEVLLGVVIALDVLGRDSRKEGKLRWNVHVGDGLCVLGLESIIPPLEVGLPPKRQVQSDYKSS